MPEKKNKSADKDVVNNAGENQDIDGIFKDITAGDKFINVPKTLMKKEEWGMLTVLSLLLAGIFPAYFVNILLISFFTEVGHFFTTHITEVEKKKAP